MATTRLRVGSGIALVIQRDPIITAKEAASIDVLSGGRFEFGVGAGWNREEMANHGTDPRTRMRLFAERVEAMKAIWTEHEATFHGEFVDFDRILCEPKPAQRPHPPILVGGLGPTVIDRVLAFGDAWFPNWTPDVLDRAAELRRRAERPIDFMVMGPPADPKVLEELAAAGTRRVSWWLPSGGYSVIEPALEKVELGDRGTQRRSVSPGGRRAPVSPPPASPASPPPTPRGSPHIVPIAFAVDGRHHLQRGRRETEADARRCAGSPTCASQPGGLPAGRPLGRGRLGGAAGGRGPTAAAASSPPMTRRRAGPWSCSASATRASRRPARCSRSRSSAGAAGRDRPKAIERRARSPGRP